MRSAAPTIWAAISSASSSPPLMTPSLKTLPRHLSAMRTAATITGATHRSLPTIYESLSPAGADNGYTDPSIGANVPIWLLAFFAVIVIPASDAAQLQLLAELVEHELRVVPGHEVSARMQGLEPAGQRVNRRIMALDRAFQLVVPLKVGATAVG